MAAFYANENFPLGVVRTLRALGHDVVTTADAGNAGQAVADVDVLAHAAALGRTLLTLNRRDFIRLHGETPDHSGIVVCTQDPDIEGQARRIDVAIAGLGSLAAQLIRVNRPQA